MSVHILDNAIWNALTTHQSHFALGGALAKRYMAEVAPFIAVAEESPSAFAELMGLAMAEEVLYLVGVKAGFPAGGAAEDHSSLIQMVWTGPDTTYSASERYTVLGPNDVPDMLELTALAFPGFFRPRTIEMGTYLGIHRDGRLVAMAGERLYLTGYREISGVCTHPDYRGQGFAQQLMAVLVQNMLQVQGLTPFLHVGVENLGARRIYEKMGFVVRRELPFTRIEFKP